MSELQILESIDILKSMHEPVPSARQLRELHPLSQEAIESIHAHRDDVRDILLGSDTRFLIIAGPCSLDGEQLDDGTFAAVKYSESMRAIMRDQQFSKLFKFVERCNPAKPRTDVGPRGFEQDNIVLAHSLLTQIATTGNALTFEIMNDKQLARYGDMLSMAWVGARDVSNTDLRHAISAYPDIPFFFKNDEYGNMQSAINAQRAVAQSHRVEIHDENNQLVHVMASGNHTTGLIDRGGSVRNPSEFMRRMESQDVSRLIIDTSHFNGAAFDPKNIKSVQGHLDCALSVAELIKADHRPLGIMIESYLIAGAGDLPGQSKTDPCLDIEQTVKVLETLARAITTKS